MSSLVIFFSVVRGGGTVRVCSQFVEFRSSLVRVVGHRAIGPRFRFPIRHSLPFSHCPIVHTSLQMAPNYISGAITNGLLGRTRIG